MEPSGACGTAKRASRNGGGSRGWRSSMTAEPDELLDALAAAWAEVTEPPLPEGAVQNEEWLEQFKEGVREEVAAMLEIQRAIIGERPWLATELLKAANWKAVPVEPTEE